MKKRLYLFILGFCAISLLGTVVGCVGQSEAGSTSSITAVVSSTISGTTSTTPIPMKVNFSADVTGLATADFTVTNGTISNLASVSAREYTFDFTPTAYGSISVYVIANAVADSNGAANIASNTLSITYAATAQSSFKVSMVDSGNHSYYMNKAGAFGTACEVTQSAASGQDYTCYLDVNEGDMWFWGLSLKVESPAAMCRYMRIENYYFYNYEVGYGPQDVDVYLDLDSAAGATFPAGKFPTMGGTCARNGANTCCVVDGVTYQPCTGVTELASVNGTTGAVSCLYNYNDVDTALPNCCLGSYNYSTHILTKGAASVTDTSESGLDWEGKAGNCMAGPAVSDSTWPKDARTAMPFRSVYYNAKPGFSKTMDLGKPSTSLTNGNVLVANYYQTTATPHAHTADGAGSSNLPWALDPIADRSGSALPIANPEYVFNCMNEAFEIVHRLTLYVRDWNTPEKFSAYVGTAPTLLPDVVGTAPANCTEVAAGLPCNDRYDWDDFIMNQTTGAFTGYTHDATPANWSLYFPAIE